MDSINSNFRSKVDLAFLISLNKSMQPSINLIEGNLGKFAESLLIWLDQSRGDRLFFISSSLARDPQLVSVNRRSDHTDIRGLITAFHLFVWGYLTLVPCVQIFLRTKERRGFPVPDDNTNY